MFTIPVEKILAYNDDTNVIRFHFQSCVNTSHNGFEKMFIECSIMNHLCRI